MPKRTKKLQAAKQVVKVVVACRNSAGEPDFFFCIVKCWPDNYDVGDHYDLAEDYAAGEGYEGPYVCFDENDGPVWLFDYFEWDSATVIE